MPASGNKIRAGKMLSKFLKQIADEETEFVSDPNKGDHMASKAEALARLIWKLGLGYTEKTKEMANGVEITREREIKPDKAMIQLIWDRLEGKAESASDQKQQGLSLPERMAESRKNVLNSLSGAPSADGHT